MATFATSQEWLHQCSLLLEARPQTTKITTRYSIKPKPARRVAKNKAADDKTLPDAPAAKSASASASSTSQNPRAKLVLKAVDPASGVCLRYKTTKAAEVSRLVQLLGRLSRRQAGLIAAAEEAATDAAADDVVMAEAEPAAAAAAAAATPTPAPQSQPAHHGQQQQHAGGGGGGGKGKKKKGKR